MATYASYKKYTGENIENGAITDSKISSTALRTWNVQWFYGNPVMCSSGCCCLWTVPSNTRKAFIELWGAGGNGHGACDCNRCQGYFGAGGGTYNSKMICVTPGWTYTVCAAGVFPCLTTECQGCQGCASYVTGCNLSNFCAVGGRGGIGADFYWCIPTFSCWDCCIAPTANGGDFAMANHTGQVFSGSSWCHCHCKVAIPQSAPFIGTQVIQHFSCFGGVGSGSPGQSCFFRCGCFTVPYGHGGQGAMVSVCANAVCGQGGTGGPGLVKITYI